MGTILASAIVDKVEIVLQDTTNVRWPASEHLGWLNDGQREICAVFPEVSSTTANITLVVGTKQALPAGGISLLKIIRNMGVGGATAGQALRKVPQEILDSQLPGWHAETAATILKHYVYDPRAPRVFYVYPPSVVSNTVEALYTVSPTDIASLSTAIGIDDIYANSLVDYCLYRAYSKDMDLAGNADRADKAYTRFQTLLSAKKVVDASAQPADAIRG